ncbi:hypothetical protein LJC46_10195 [Desulfovibrio sp. OttesenSCG-928-G15]|nr:hypothetical protein [Desulfovibrio sp. OttesenSCG-928-G15]
MYLSEMKKGELWCPFARVLYLDTIDNEGAAAGYNRYEVSLEDEERRNLKVPAESLCIKGKCAVWRSLDVSNPKQGFCGIAGKL